MTQHPEGMTREEAVQHYLHFSLEKVGENLRDASNFCDERGGVEEPVEEMQLLVAMLLDSIASESEEAKKAVMKLISVVDSQATS